MVVTGDGELGFDSGAASGHMLVSKIKPCMSKYKPRRYTAKLRMAHYIGYHRFGRVVVKGNEKKILFFFFFFFAYAWITVVNPGLIHAYRSLVDFLGGEDPFLSSQRKACIRRFFFCFFFLFFFFPP